MKEPSLTTEHICDVFKGMVQGTSESIFAGASTWGHVMDPANGQRKRTVAFYLMEIPRPFPNDATEIGGVKLPPRWETREPRSGVNDDGIPWALTKNARRQPASIRRFTKQWRNKKIPDTKHTMRCERCRHTPGKRKRCNGTCEFVKQIDCFPNTPCQGLEPITPM